MSFLNGKLLSAEVIWKFLTVTKLWAISADNIFDDTFLIFFQAIEFDMSYKLSLEETVFMKCQIQISGKNRKTTSKCYLLKIDV